MNFELETSQAPGGEGSKDLGSHSGSSGRRAPPLPAFEFTDDTTDLIKFVDHNERRHQTEAQRFLRQNSFLGSRSQDKNNIKQHVITSEEPLAGINTRMITQFNYTHAKPTVVMHTEDLVLVGTSQGEVWMYDAES